MVSIPISQAPTIGKVGMMATTNSGMTTAGLRRAADLGKLCPGLVLWFAIMLVCPEPVVAQTNQPAAESPAARIERIYHEAWAQTRRSPNDTNAAWQFGRACFDWADFAVNDQQRETIAQQGITACQRALELNAQSTPARYYLAMNRGQLARTKTLGALKLVQEMEADFKTAIELDPSFDHAGPHRSLGMLYRDAPGWPTSIGSRARAQEHLAKAVELSPDYPDNQLSLLEAWLQWGEKKKVYSCLKSVEAILWAGRQKLTGPDWQASWQDWDERWKKIKAKATFASTESPRTKK
jgi:tetratricopeptide (TPR) repeat protein